MAVLDYPSYSALTESGEPVGLAMDYLAALAQYTGWTYEYVPLTLTEARQQLLSGEIDMIPGRSLNFSDEALYGEKSMGSSNCVLVCRADDDRYAFQDYDAFTDMRVGMLAGSDYRSELERMQSAMGFQVDTVLFNTHEACMLALENEHVDALLMLNIRRDDTTKDIARFGSTDLYMAVTPHKPELLEELNHAQEQLYSNDPYCMLRWWEKYYGNSLVSLNLTRAELNYLEEHNHLKIGILSTLPVYAYADDQQQAVGIVPELMQMVAQRMNITLEILPSDSCEQLLDDLRSGRVDAVLPIHASADAPALEGIQLLPLMSVHLSMAGLGNKDLHDLSNMTIALGSDFVILQQIVADSLSSESRIQTCTSLEEALDAVQDSEATAVVADEYSLHKLMERPAYRDLTVYPVYSIPVSLCIGLTEDADPLLVSALDKTIATLSSDEVETAIMEHTVGMPYHYTMTDVLQQFREPLIIVLVLAVILLTVLISASTSARIHRRRMAASRAALDRETQERQKLQEKSEADARHREELRFMATHDNMTGLYNMNGFDIAVKRLLSAHPDEPYKIVYMDINGFKVFTDLFGTKAGESVILSIARRFEEYATADICYAQVYKDHFVICVPEWVDVDELSHHETLWLRELIPNYELIPSFGEYIIRDRSEPVSIMCDRAISAMNTVKGLYPPRVGRYTQDLRESLLEEQWVTANMRQALNNGEFIPYFQPQYHLYTGQITGAEVLVRWHSKDKGFITPGRFVPIFEKNGFITEMDQYIWELSCKWLRGWIDAGNPPIALSINASRLDVRNLDLPTLLPRLVQRYNLSPSLIRLEITESAYMQDPDQLIRTMRALQQSGFTIEMDDFGSGYSSLNLLKDVPVDVLKLDMRFLSSGDEFGRSASIIRSVINMSKWLNLSVIAEGVETVQQSDFLKSIGCTHAQGYRYSKPVNTADFELLLRSANILVTDERRSGTVTVQPDRAVVPGTHQLIMIVDDKEVRRSRLREILGSEYHYIEADSGDMAMSMLHAGFTPDCVLLDSEMPGLTGYEVLKAIRSKPETHDLLVLMILPLSGENDVTIKALEYGVNDFIYTPFMPEMIRHRVRNQLLLQAAMRQAQIDGLTGLLNRTTFRHCIETALQSREGSPAQGMMITMDLDSFKNLNDLYGHPFGDKVLTAFADVLTEVCGDRAIIGRLGGDEFGILVPDVSSREEMQHLVDTLLERAKRIVIDGKDDLVSCSLGASIYPADFVRRADLYAAADKALYAAKQKGNGYAMFYDQLPLN